MDRPDGRLNAWILAWDVHALLHEPARLFQAPIFHPLPDALAFSENLLLPAVLGAPAHPARRTGARATTSCCWRASSSPASARSSWCAARSGDRLAAFVAGVFFAAGAHRWIRLAHLHAQVTLFLPFALLALDRFLEKRTWRRALLVGVLLGLQGLSSVYLGAITALALAVAVGWLVAAFRARDLAKLAAAFVLAAVDARARGVAVPAHARAPGRGVHARRRRASTRPRSSRTRPRARASTAALTQRHLDPERVQDALFPGLTLLVLGIAGLAARAAAVPGRGRWPPPRSPSSSRWGRRPRSTASSTSTWCWCAACARSRASRWCRCSRCACSPGSRWRGAGGWRSSPSPPSPSSPTLVPIRYAPAPAPSETAAGWPARAGAVAYLPLGERDTDVMLDGGRALPAAAERRLGLHAAPVLAGDGAACSRRSARRRCASCARSACGTWSAATELGRCRVVATFGGRARLRRARGRRGARPPRPARGRGRRPGRRGASSSTSARAGWSSASSSRSRTRSGWRRRGWRSRSTARRWERVAARASLADAVAALYADPRHGPGRGALRAPARRAGCGWTRGSPRARRSSGWTSMRRRRRDGGVGSSGDDAAAKASAATPGWRATAAAPAGPGRRW